MDELDRSFGGNGKDGLGIDLVVPDACESRWYGVQALADHDTRWLMGQVAAAFLRELPARPVLPVQLTKAFTVGFGEGLQCRA